MLTPNRGWSDNVIERHPRRSGYKSVVYLPLKPRKKRRKNMPTNHDGKDEKWDFNEFLQYSERLIADGIIRDGFKSIRSSMYNIINVYDQCKKEGWKVK